MTTFKSYNFSSVITKHYIYGNYYDMIICYYFDKFNTIQATRSKCGHTERDPAINLGVHNSNY